MTSFRKRHIHSIFVTGTAKIMNLIGCAVIQISNQVLKLGSSVWGNECWPRSRVKTQATNLTT